SKSLQLSEDAHLKTTDFTAADSTIFDIERDEIIPRQNQRMTAAIVHQDVINNFRGSVDQRRGRRSIRLHQFASGFGFCQATLTARGAAMFPKHIRGGL